MHIPDQNPLVAKVDGTHGVEDGKTRTAAANTVPPQTGLQNSPAIDGWGSLPWGGLPGYLTDLQSRASAHTDASPVGPFESTWPGTGDKQSSWHAHSQDPPKTKEEGTQGAADERSRTPVTSMKHLQTGPQDPLAIDWGDASQGEGSLDT